MIDTCIIHHVLGFTITDCGYGIIHCASYTRVSGSRITDILCIIQTQFMGTSILDTSITHAYWIHTSQIHASLMRASWMHASQIIDKLYMHRGYMHRGYMHRGYMHHGFMQRWKKRTNQHGCQILAQKIAHKTRISRQNSGKSLESGLLPESDL